MIQNSVQKINYCGNNLKVNTMKKHISLVLAFAAAIACTKLSPEDLTTIESLPQKENTENISEESRGERITIKLPQTKVTLDGDTYVFESGDAITVVATNGAKAVLTTTSAAATGEFSGDFDRQVGLEKDNFTFYYNYNGTDSNEQNGKPWLIAMAACTRVDGTFTPDEGTVNFKQPSGIVAIAIKSSESYTVDFCSIDGTQKYENLSIVQNVPFFLNVNSGLPGGFYLAVHNGDQVMYTRYGNDGTTIIANTPVTIKPFVAFTGVQNLKIENFETSYSYYQANDVNTANSKTNSWMNEGTVTFDLAGISSSLYEFSFKVNEETVSGSLSKLDNTFTYTFGESSHTTLGAYTLTATVSFKYGIAENVSTSVTRYITGLPYNVTCPTTDNGWKATRGSNNINWTTDYVELKAARSTSGNLKPLIQKDFYTPKALDISLSFSYELYSFYITALKIYTTTMTLWISSQNVFKDTTSGKDVKKTSTKVDATLASDKSYIEFEAYSDGTGADYGANAKIKSIEMLYR